MSEERHESQPYVSRRGFYITWDGRLDNRDELAANLGLDIQTGRADVAIFASAFDRWETNCFTRILGDWAAVVWKPDDKELIFAVDYLAIRHIFYRISAKALWWSTDLKTLVLVAGETHHLNLDYIAGYFANEPDAHLTPYQEISEVPPGHFLHVKNGTESLNRYWFFSPRKRITYPTDSEYEEHFRYLFRQSVRRRLRSDAPILAELSGGLDSSSIVCVADHVSAHQGANGPRLDTFSYCDNTEPEGDDWRYISEVETWRGQAGIHVDSSILGISPASLTETEFVPTPGSLGLGRNLANERSAKISEGGYKVVLSGFGGDELMGGIPDPAPQLADLILQLNFVQLSRELFRWGLVKRRPWLQLLRQAAGTQIPVALSQYFSDQAKPASWIRHDFARRYRLAVRQIQILEPFGFSLPSRKALMSGIVLIAKKMAKRGVNSFTAIEMRYPYLDRDLVEFMLSIPASQLLRPGERRSLMRRALAGIVPQRILSRKTKQVGARTPTLALEKARQEVEMAFDSPLVSHLGLINRERFLEAFESALHGKPVHLVRLARTVSLEFWLRQAASQRVI